MCVCVTHMQLPLQIALQSHSVCVYAHISMICVYEYMCICVYVYMCIRVYVYMYICVLCIFSCVYVCMCHTCAVATANTAPSIPCICVCVHFNDTLYRCMCVYVYMCTCVYVYRYACIFELSAIYSYM